MDVLCDLIDAIGHILIGCVVHENIYAAHFGERLINKFLAIFRLGDVGGEQVTFPFVLFDQPLGLFTVFLFFRQVRNYAIGPFHGVENCNGSPDS